MRFHGRLYIQIQGGATLEIDEAVKKNFLKQRLIGGLKVQLYSFFDFGAR